MSEQLQQLKSIFHDIFQLDQADLDFGIYRIMRQKRAEVDAYLEGQLLNDLKLTAAREYDESSKSIKAKIVEAKRHAFELGYNPDDAPLVKKLEQEIQEMALRESLEDSVLSDLVQFLGRYYKEGDFLSLPRYRKNSYAIEYNGEEVKLHWANADQYYVKTAERFRDYRFLLPDGKAVHFKITAANTEAGNNKAETGKERRFALSDNDFMKEETGELLIFFRYSSDEQKRKQAEINAETIKRILEEGKNFIQWRKALSEAAPTEKNKTRTLLEKHLNDYTARNTFDYFIHKDLDGFLRRELDFYIKNEIIMLDDIENEDVPRVELYLGKVKALRRIGHKLIAFLAQVENFCKKLFLKKKFVIRANYCATLDRVPRSLWADVLANEAQINEWRELYAIDEIEADLFNQFRVTPLGVKKPPRFAGGFTAEGRLTLNAEFLEANQNLIIDTRHFSEDWKLKLLESFEDLDAETDGLLIKADNFHALNLLQEKYHEAVKCIYIDPPYNTGNDGFMYRDGYQHSSWLSMMENRLERARQLMSNDGAIFTSVDDTEVSNLRFLNDAIFGNGNLLGILAWEKRYAPPPDTKDIGYTHESIVANRKSESFVRNLLPLTSEQRLRYKNPDKDPRGDWKAMDYTCKYSKSERPNLYYPIIHPKTGEQVYPKETRVWGCSYDEHLENEKNNLIWWGVEGNAKVPAKKNFVDKIQQGFMPMSLLNKDDFGHTDEASKELKDLIPNLKFTVKPKRLVEGLAKIASNESDTILDFFAGSATTAHAVINLNREDGGRRKYILVETNEYFDSVTLPRVKKVVYSKDWKDGKPVSRQGSPHLLKYFALESYEDAMNNLALNKAEELEQAGLQFTNEFREDYLLNYCLEFETRGSPSLLNLDNLSAPFDYRMKIAVNGVGETQETPVDLCETFNYLIGLDVENVRQIDGFRVIRGKTRKGERCLILWRTTKDLKQELADKRLNDFLEKQNFDFSEIDTLYINGDVAIPVGDVRKENATWQIKMIEAEFLKRMFE